MARYNVCYKYKRLVERTDREVVLWGFTSWVMEGISARTGGSLSEKGGREGGRGVE